MIGRHLGGGRRQVPTQRKHQTAFRFRFQIGQVGQQLPEIVPTLRRRQMSRQVRKRIGRHRPRVLLILLPARVGESLVPGLSPDLIDPAAMLGTGEPVVQRPVEEGVARRALRFVALG